MIKFGDIILQPFSCVVNEEACGQYELTLTHPLDERVQGISNGSVIAVPVPAVDLPDAAATGTWMQQFRVYSREADTAEHTLTIHARHISYDASNLILGPSANYEGVPLATAVPALQGAIIGAHSIQLTTNRTDALTANYRLMNLMEAILDPDYGIAYTHRAKVIRDNEQIHILNNPTIDRGVSIRHGKNLMGVLYTVNMEDVVTRIIPVGRDQDGNDILLPEVFIDSPSAGSYPKPISWVMEVDDAKVRVDEREPANNVTLADVYAMLREAVAQEWLRGADKPAVTLDVEFIALGDTEEYAQYKNLEPLQLYDTVPVIDTYHGFEVAAQVIAYEWNCLTLRYENVRLGEMHRIRMGGIAGYELPNRSISGEKLRPNDLDGSRLRDLSVTNIKIGLAAIDRTKIGKAAIGEAEIDEAAVGRIHIKDGAIEDVHIGTAGIDYAKLKDLAAGTAIIRDGIGGRLIIDRLAVSEANIVSLTAGQLIVQGTSGALYRLTVDEQGEIITELRQIGNNDIKNVSLNAGEKLIKSSITADLLNVQQIFASEALIGAIKVHNIEAHSIGTDQLVPGLFESMIMNATGQQLVVEFSHGTILDRERTQTVARLRVFHIGVDITDRMPDNAINWERISEDQAGDVVWNADPEHQNTKSVTIRASDVNFRGVLRCKVDEARLFAVPSVDDDGNLIMTDYGNDDSLNFALVDGDLVYYGDTAYEMRDGILYTDMLIGASHIDTQMSNLKTSYLDISRYGIEMYSDGYLNLISGALFDLQAGSGSSFMRLTNKDPFTRLIIGGENKDTAPFWVGPDGEVRATKLRLNNSNITEFTQHYPYSDVDNASPTHPMVFDVFIPSEYSGIQSMKLSFKLEPFRAYSTGAASGGGSTSSAGGGGARTSRSGGGSTATTSQNVGNTGDMTSATNTRTADGPGSHAHQMGSHYHNMAHTHTVSISSHTHIVDIPDHTHTVPNHTHGIVYGIYQGTTASSCQVRVDGTLIGSFSALSARDVTAQLSKVGGKITRDGWHTVTLTPNALTRIRAQVFVVGVVAQAGAAIY